MPTFEEKTALLAAVKDLREYDHCFLNEEGVAKFAEAFGVVLKPRRHKADVGPKNPKGLTLHNGAKSMVGMDASIMAQIICDQLGIKYAEKFGRGSQLRACCDALEEHYKQ